MFEKICYRCGQPNIRINVHKLVDGYVCNACLNKCLLLPFHYSYGPGIRFNAFTTAQLESILQKRYELKKIFKPTIILEYDKFSRTVEIDRVNKLFTVKGMLFSFDDIKSIDSRISVDGKLMTTRQISAAVGAGLNGTTGAILGSLAGDDTKFYNVNSKITLSVGHSIDGEQKLGKDTIVINKIATISRPNAITSVSKKIITELTKIQILSFIEKAEKSEAQDSDSVPLNADSHEALKKYEDVILTKFDMSKFDLDAWLRIAPLNTKSDYIGATTSIKLARDGDGYRNVANLFIDAKDYKDSKEKAVEMLEKAVPYDKDAIYFKAKELMNSGTNTSYTDALMLLKRIPDWRNSAELIDKCESRVLWFMFNTEKE